MTTFWGRIPKVPPIAPVTAPTTVGPTGVTRSAAHPTGATKAALTAMRCHSAGISPGRWRARATASDAPSPAPPSNAPRPVARRLRCAVSAAPAIPPTTAEKPTAFARSPGAGRSEGTTETYMDGNSVRTVEQPVEYRRGRWSVIDLEVDKHAGLRSCPAGIVRTPANPLRRLGHASTCRAGVGAHQPHEHRGSSRQPRAPRGSAGPSRS